MRHSRHTYATQMIRSGVIDALLSAQHVLEMFRRALPEGASRTSLARLSNRLAKILAEARKLPTP